MILQPRPYQRQALDELYNWFYDNPDGNPIVSACVGAGKSVMIALLCHEAVHNWSVRSRVLITVPSKELAEQNYAKLEALGTGLRIGVLSASLGRKDYVHDKDVILGTVGTLVKAAERLGLIDLILVDECHLANRADTGMYRHLVKGCQRNNAAVRVVGWTGTPFRGNGVWLTEGEDRLFTDIAARIAMRDLLKQGFLAPLVVAKPKTQVSGEGLKTQNGDYIVSALAQRLDQSELTEKIADEIVEHGRDRRRWLVFGVTVEHATHLAAALVERGISCAVVSANTPKPLRETYIAAFRSGKLRALVNVAVLTTGFDVPEVDLIALVRNTKSPVLYTQIGGRGMRTVPGKTDCLWLDFTDTTALLGPLDEIKGRCETKKKPDDERTVPTKICEECGAQNLAGASVCKSCGEAFPAPTPSINTVASQAAILSGVPRLETIPVEEISYQSHLSHKTNIPYLQILFKSDLSYYRLNLMIQHDGYARKKAIEKWCEITTPATNPANVIEAIQSLLHGRVKFKEIESITVDFNSKWKDVTKIHFRKQHEEEAA